ncbi:MAG: L-serine ammonia-lyase, partial [Mesorhizobium sp.]
SDRAVVLGLAGQTPQTVDPDEADGIVARIGADKRISPPGHPTYRFDPAKDLVLDRKTPLTGHANGMAFYAYDASDRLLLKRIYYSIGGGFVVSEEELQRMKAKGSVTTEGKKVPYPFKNAVEMLAMAAKSGLSIAEMKRINEEKHMSREELDAGLDAIWSAMKGCIDRGLSQDGV